MEDAGKESTAKVEVPVQTPPAPQEKQESVVAQQMLHNFAQIVAATAGQFHAPTPNPVSPEQSVHWGMAGRTGQTRATGLSACSAVGSTPALSLPKNGEALPSVLPAQAPPTMKQPSPAVSTAPAALMGLSVQTTLTTVPVAVPTPAPLSPMPSGAMAVSSKAPNLKTEELLGKGQDLGSVCHALSAGTEAERMVG